MEEEVATQWRRWREKVYCVQLMDLIRNVIEFHNKIDDDGNSEKDTKYNWTNFILIGTRIPTTNH